MHTERQRLTEGRSGGHHEQSNVVVIVVVVVCSDDAVVVESSCSGENVVAVAMETAVSSVEQCQLHQLSFLEFIFVLRLQRQQVAMTSLLQARLNTRIKGQDK